MKKQLLIILSASFLISCNNKEKNMLKEYQQENASALNINIDDLDFKVESIKKIKDITSSDSSKIVKQELVKLWGSEFIDKTKDSITFEYVIKELEKSVDKSQKLYDTSHELVLSSISEGDYIGEYNSKDTRDKASDVLLEFRVLLGQANELNKIYTEYKNDKDKVLSVKYEATYSMKNPMLGNVKQTFHKYFYSDRNNEKFLFDENIEKDIKK